MISSLFLVLSLGSLRFWSKASALSSFCITIPDHSFSPRILAFPLVEKAFGFSTIPVAVALSIMIPSLPPIVV